MSIVDDVVVYLNKFKSNGDDDGCHRSVWWFLFKPSYDSNFYRRIGCGCKDNAVCYLEYVKFFNDDLLLTNNLAAAIRIFQSKSYLVGYIQYPRCVSRGKAMYDLKLRNWCVVGVPPHICYPTKNLLCHTQDVVSPEGKAITDNGELTDVYNFLLVQVGLGGIDYDWWRAIAEKWADNKRTVAYSHDMAKT